MNYNICIIKPKNYPHSDAFWELAELLTYSLRDLENDVVMCISEIFADRGYNKNGSLVPRGEKGALITDTKYAINRLVHFFQTGEMPTVCGNFIKMNAHSICIHGDNSNAVDMARNIKSILAENNIKIKSFI